MKINCWFNQNRFLSHLALLPRLAIRLVKSQFAWALVLVSGVVLIMPSVATAEDTHNTVFSVMTRNMDLGSDYGPALAAHDPQSFFHGVTTIYNEIVASNIAERAAGIAREIQETMPTVVSLQEVSLVQRFVWTGTQGPFIDQIDQLAPSEPRSLNLVFPIRLLLKSTSLTLLLRPTPATSFVFAIARRSSFDQTCPPTSSQCPTPKPATITIYSRSKRPSAP